MITQPILQHNMAVRKDRCVSLKWFTDDCVDRSAAHDYTVYFFFRVTELQDAPKMHF